jgi:hypothetical protein
VGRSLIHSLIDLDRLTIVRPHDGAAETETQMIPRLTIISPVNGDAAEKWIAAWSRERLWRQL